MTDIFTGYSIQTWISALIGAGSVSLVGVLPLFVVPDEGNKSKFY